MARKVVIVPVDGATNIKLEVLDFETLQTLFSTTTQSPSREVDSLLYNATGEEFDWFDRAVASLPAEFRRDVQIIAPVARGASGGLIGRDGSLTEVEGEGLTLSYDQHYPERVEARFRELAGSEEEFFLETGSIRDFPGSLTLIKRFVFEEVERHSVLRRSEGFATYGVLMTGHFLGDDYLWVVKRVGNEHSYWMCHSGARNINEKPGTPSSLAQKLESFGRLVPREPALCYRPTGKMPRNQASSLGLSGSLLVIPGGHDTCLSHIPILATFYQTFPALQGKPVIHVDAGSWTVVARMGGKASLPRDGYRRDILVQGTADGEPVVTARYGGGRDFRYLKSLAEKKGPRFDQGADEQALRNLVEAREAFVLPNISPENLGTGPFPSFRGRIVNEAVFFESGLNASILASLCTAITTVEQIEAIAESENDPVVITAGGSMDPYFGRLVATLTERNVYALFDREGRAVAETTTLGAGIVGKSAALAIHPYEVDMSSFGASYRELEPFDHLESALQQYRDRFLSLLSASRT